MSHEGDETDAADKPPLLGYAGTRRVRADGPAEEQDACFHEGPVLIAPNGAALPPYCVLCGMGVAGRPAHLIFTWDNSFQFTRISTLQLRQKAEITAGMCARHGTAWRRARWIGGAGIVLSVLIMLVGLGVAVLSESSDVPEWTGDGIAITIAGFAGVIFWLFYFTLRTRTMSCMKIHEGYLYLTGASPAFLAKLPRVPRAHADSGGTGGSGEANRGENHGH